MWAADKPKFPTAAWEAVAAIAIWWYFAAMHAWRLRQYHYKLVASWGVKVQFNVLTVQRAKLSSREGKQVKFRRKSTVRGVM